MTSALSSPILPAQADFGAAMMRAKTAGAEKLAANTTANPAATAKLSAQQLQTIDKTAKEYEGMFLAEMLSHMFSGIEVDTEFGGGKGEEMFRSLLVQEYGKKIAEGPGLGIAAKVKEVMIQAQAASITTAE